MVFGYVTTESEDADGETVKKQAVADALDEYMAFANIREMHQNSAVGKVKEATIDNRGLYIAAKIVDAAAWQKVVEGVYQGFSIGGRALARDPSNRKIITKIRLNEISVVDRPANEQALLEIAKAAGFTVTAEGDPVLASFRDALRQPYVGDAGLMKLLRQERV
jgi:HK97 family phage prohead protease